MDRELYIVDDSPDHQFLLYKLIKGMEMPYLVKFFENGRSLHKHLQQLSRSEDHARFPDLLVLDLNMPAMNGIELLRLLRQPPLASHPRISTLPIVVMSNDISPTQMHQCYQAGANAVIVKPLSVTVMKNTIQSICKFWMN
ncbi:response regulator [Dyadobacter sp. CY323]|uniref:response regulator n=1 Tax=Dyadobacter sp. CY323 TaxID=2907302 RepID=UPI001F33A481|nr:response regulator [Dyadobacter sp. CY323]MCE6992947.1 response regulator [Dyadobacter sp. CY323]